MNSSNLNLTRKNWKRSYVTKVRIDQHQTLVALNLEQWRHFRELLQQLKEIGNICNLRCTLSSIYVTLIVAIILAMYFIPKIQRITAKKYISNTKHNFKSEIISQYLKLIIFKYMIQKTSLPVILFKITSTLKRRMVGTKLKIVC